MTASSEQSEPAVVGEQVIQLDLARFGRVGETQPYARLLGHVVINGTCFHAEAIEVTEDANGVQIPVDEDLRDWFDKVYLAIEGDGGPWASVQHQGREYVLIISPFLT